MFHVANLPLYHRSILRKATTLYVIFNIILVQHEDPKYYDDSLFPNGHSFVNSIIHICIILKRRIIKRLYMLNTTHL